MKHLKIAGLCLASMFVMGMALASTASAVVWEGCLEKSPTTRYREANCAEALGTGEWGWLEIKNTDKVIGIGFTISLTDKNVPIIGSTSAICTAGGRTKGTVGPGEFDRIEVAEVEGASKNCTGTGGCKAAGIKVVKGVNLPWQTKLTTENGRFLDIIENSGKGEPGWEVECENILSKTTRDVCESEGEANLEHLILTNILSPEFNNLGKNVQLVRATFAKRRLAKCSQGGAGSGAVLGVGAILLANANFEPSGKGLRVN